MPFQALAGRMIETAHEFMALTWKVLPFFLIGAIAGAALQAAMLRKGSERILGGRGIRPLLAAASAAALLPGCSCATMPMAAGIKDVGAPAGGSDPRIPGRVFRVLGLRPGRGCMRFWTLSGSSSTSTRRSVTTSRMSGEGRC